MTWAVGQGGILRARHGASAHKNSDVFATFTTVFYPLHVNIMRLCMTFNLVGVGALILVCERGRLLPGKVSHSEVRDREGGGDKLTSDLPTGGRGESIK